MFFFYQGFLSRTLSTHRRAGEGRGPSFIPLYHFYPLTNIQTFVFVFACEITITYFWSHRLYLPDCYSMRFATLWNYHSTDWLCDVNFRLITWWFDSVFFTAIRHGKPVQLGTGNRTRIDYHPCITSQPTKEGYAVTLFKV